MYAKKMMLNLNPLEMCTQVLETFVKKQFLLQSNTGHT